MLCIKFVLKTRKSKQNQVEMFVFKAFWIDLNLRIKKKSYNWKREKRLLIPFIQATKSFNYTQKTVNYFRATKNLFF